LIDLSEEDGKPHWLCNKRIKANVLKGCAPGGFYDQLDEAIRGGKAECC
jgi:hypothetical protein